MFSLPGNQRCRKHFLVNVFNALPRSVVPILTTSVFFSTAAFADGKQNFVVDFVLHKASQESIEQLFIPLAADQRVLDVALDLSRIEAKQTSQGLALRGVLSFTGDQTVAMIGVDEDANGQIDDLEMRLQSATLTAPIASNGQRLLSYSGKSMVHLKLNCACTGSNKICSTRNIYKISFVDAATGAAIWGPESHDGVMHNECIFDALLGSSKPIPEEIASRDPATVKVKMTCGSHTQTVPLYAALSGSQGPKGDVGERGEKGGRGDIGPTGATGIAGSIGPIGPAGMNGAVGPQGERGEKGVAGEKGEAGIKGDKGIAGEKGDRGEIGPSGVAGPIGPTGLTGAAGASGPAGATGAIGPIGPAGLTGPIGATGSVGPVGATGPAGIAGANGSAGAIGPTGPPGIQGPIGPSGSIGATGAPGAIGPIGPKGDKGDRGEPGSDDIDITGSDNLITIRAPEYMGTVFDSQYVDSRLTALSDSIESKADAVRVDGRTVKTKAVANLALSRTAGRWNDIGTFDDQATILSLSATVTTAPGEFLLVNSNDDLKIRIIGGKIQEFHNAPTLGGKPIYIEVRAF